MNEFSSPNRRPMTGEAFPSPVTHRRMQLNFWNHTL